MLNEKIIDLTLAHIKENIAQWKQLIANSFLSPSMQDKYLQVLAERKARLGI